ncbi:DMT family transporter [Gimibacter soli]|uniref:DMT family transporter n=1 Tax=Gimibacter soli TaxID=3024400 RepID=A0AAE9XNC6_9PROT|nr:DMT family transporter [Gimibacter soli]WCL54203.1 DMT family transporter [Gimibacter soli]
MVENGAPDTARAMTYGLTAATIWGAWPIVTSIGVTGTVPADLVTILRFLVSGLLLLPFAFRGRMTRTDWGRSLVLTFIAGAGYTFIVSNGVGLAPAAHGGLIIPSGVLVFSLLGSHFLLGDRLTTNRAMGAAIIIAGIGAIATARMGDGLALQGDALFIVGGMLWASYTVLLKYWKLDPLTATARISVLSLIVLLPFLPDAIEPLSAAPLGDVLLQAVWQGVMSSIVAGVLFGKAVSVLGAGRAAILNSLTPALAILLAIVILGDWPRPAEWLGLVLVVSGMAVALKVRKVAPAPLVAEAQKA